MKVGFDFRQILNVVIDRSIIFYNVRVLILCCQEEAWWHHMYTCRPDSHLNGMDVNLYPSWVCSQRPILGYLCKNWRGKG